MKTALITGITGQDGSYLAEFLLGKGYEVHGIVRRSSSFNTRRIDSIFHQLHLHYGDLIDSSSINRILEEVRPDEIYNLGAQSHVHISFQIPEYTAEATALGTLRILDAIRERGLKTRFYQASSSELFGDAVATPQNEDTPFRPRSPYAYAKLYAYWATVNYREAYGLFACNGILFNHESPRRGEIFISRKVTRAVAQIQSGKLETLVLGNLDARRDWGYAPEYVEAMWLMLQQKEPGDFVVATNEAHSVREFCEEAFRFIGKELVWRGEGLDEKGYDRITGQVLVEVDPKYFRPTEVSLLQGDYARARENLGWEPRTGFRDLVRIMMSADLQGEGC